MLDFVAAREFMVQGQLRVNDVTEPRLTTAMLEVPREKFVPAPLAELAYLDRDLLVTPAGAKPPRYLVKPLTLAKMVQIAEVGDTDRVLDVGCVTGYAAAVLARVARSIVALEENPELAREAERNLSGFGLSQVPVVTGPLRDGWPSGAPYDVILVEGRVETAPRSLLPQLAVGGRLVCVQGGETAAKGTIYRSVYGDGRPVFDVAAPLLPGFAESPVFVF